ncbi:hypothetical protein [Candidatus Nitrososphaera sp. FF02]|uniref:hypothetical protein n=1 Tax=Candidatus Nitrososphaera sp. FF02 TaxID=3398226 RepID=UPI0039EBBA69
MASPQKQRGIIGGGIAAVVVVAIMFVPLVPVTAQESYTEMEKREESYVDVETQSQAYTDVEKRREQYTVVEKRSEPYIVTQERQENLYYLDDVTLEGGDNRSWSSYIPAGRSVELQISASDTLTTYVTSKSAYEANGNNYPAPISEQASVRYGFVTPIADSYYFYIYNPHDGFFSTKNVGLYSASLDMTWNEETTSYRTVDVPVTKYRTVDVPVTKYKDVQVPVTKYRTVDVPVTKYKDVTHNESIIQMLTKS